jgi:hypothetical protein
MSEVRNCEMCREYKTCEHLDLEIGYCMSKYFRSASPIGETVLTDKKVSTVLKLGDMAVPIWIHESYLPELLKAQDAHTRSIVIPETRGEVAKWLKEIAFRHVDTNTHCIDSRDYDFLIKCLEGK